MIGILRVEFEVVTPLFLGGADQNSELRAASIKGALRHWYRALDVDYRKREAGIWGDVRKGEGQSRVWLSLVGPEKPTVVSWPEAGALRVFDVGSGRETRNGVKYLGYTLQLPGNESRNAIAPGTRFTLEVVFPKWEELIARDHQAVIGAVWLLGHVGSLGSRARRGLGSLEIRSWSVGGDASPDLAPILESWPLLAKAQDPRDWMRKFDATLRTADEEFDFSERGRSEPDRCPRLGEMMRLVLVQSNRAISAPLGWAGPMQVAGLLLQNFRALRTPDRGIVGDHLRYLNKRGGVPMSRRSPLESPQRAAFGLPLNFRFVARERMSPDSVEFTPDLPNHKQERAKRFPSLLWIRSTRIAGKAYAQLTRLDGEMPGDRGLHYDDRSGYRGRQDPLPPPGGDLVDGFLDECARKNPQWRWSGGVSP